MSHERSFSSCHIHFFYASSYMEYSKPFIHNWIEQIHIISFFGQTYNIFACFTIAFPWEIPYTERSDTFGESLIRIAQFVL